jgi:hypothetical protein
MEPALRGSVEKIIDITLDEESLSQDQGEAGHQRQ